MALSRALFQGDEMLAQIRVENVMMTAVILFL
jgi:hypothetical protein